MLVSQAGGLGPLTKQPACNLQILGNQKRALSGFSTASILSHAGFYLFSSNCSNSSTRLSSNGNNVSPDDGIGRDLSAQIQQKIDKMLEPPPIKNNKALPKPLNIASKKRGGRRVRKTKEMIGMTELGRKTSRMNFGELQENVSQEYIGFTLDQAASTSLAGGGRIRGSIVDNKTRKVIKDAATT